MRLLALVLLLGLTGCTTARGYLGVPRDLPYVSRHEWGAAEPVSAMKRHVPERITIHHTAGRQAPARSAAEKMRALQVFSQREDALDDGRRKPAWPDVPYHLYIAVDGTVVEGRDVNYAGDSNTPYDPTGHLLIVLEGNFEEEDLTPAQRASLYRLVWSLARRWEIPADRIRGHRDFAQTLCPGARLYADLEQLRAYAAR